MNTIDDIKQVIGAMRLITTNHETFDDLQIPCDVPFVLDEDNKPVYDESEAKYESYKEFMTDCLKTLDVYVDLLEKELKVKNVELESLSEIQTYKEMKDNDVVRFPTKKPPYQLR